MKLKIIFKTLTCNLYLLRLKCSVCVIILSSGLNVVGLFQLPASMQRSVLFCCVSMIKLDRDHGKASGLL